MSDCSNCLSYTVGNPVILCDVTDPANPVEVVFNPVYDNKGTLIPLGSTVIAAEHGSGEGPDKSGFVRSYITAVGTQAILDPATVTLGSCSTPSTDVEFGEFVDPDDPKADATRVYSVIEVDAGGVPTKVWYRADDDTVYVPAAGEVFVGQGDWESRKVCLRDTGTGVVRQVTGVSVDESDEVLYDTAGITTATATEVEVACDGGDVLAPTGCATFADGTKATVTRIIPVVSGVPDYANATAVNPIDGSTSVADVNDDTVTIDLATAVLESFAEGCSCCPDATVV